MTALINYYLGRHVMDRSKSAKSCHNHKPEYVVTPVVKVEAESVQRKILVHISTLVFKATQDLTLTGVQDVVHASVFSRDVHDNLHESFDHDDEAEDGWTESSYGSSSSPMAAESRRNGTVRVPVSSITVTGSFPEATDESYFYHRFTNTQVITLSLIYHGSLIVAFRCTRRISQLIRRQMQVWDAGGRRAMKLRMR